MNNSTRPADNSPALSPKPTPGSLVVRGIWIVLSITFAIFLIFLSSGHFKLSQSGFEIIDALVYTACIAVPSIFLLTQISILCAERLVRLTILFQAITLLCTSTVGTYAGALVLVAVGIIGRSDYWRQANGELPFSITISLIFGLSISSFETLRYKLQAATLELRTRQVEQERAYKLLAEARLSSLESRIHPHFLFNTLNSISALIHSDPVRAEETVGSLASLLRFSLNAHQSGLVPLSQELKIVRDYLEIERTRFAQRLRYAIHAPDSLATVKVPPLALQSLAENSIKHVVARRPQGATIEVTATELAGRVCLEVRDDGPGFSLPDIAPDHGLANLIARMELLYGANGQLEVLRDNDQTAVRLTFPA